MLKLMEKKQKPTQYIVGGAVAIVVLFAWISIPLMQNSSLDSSAGQGSFFKTRPADVSSLGNDIPSEGGAPGYALNGGMLNNPVTSGENIASTLFQSGPDEEPPAEAPAADSSAVPPDSGRASASASAEPPPPSGPKSKLGVLPSITSGNSNSMTTGGTHNKFFGSGPAGDKPTEKELGALEKQAKKPQMPSEKRGATMAMLEKSEAKSSLAARSYNADESRGGATSAFGKSAGSGSSDLNTDMEQSVTGSGLALGAAAQDLKRNDPQVSSKKITLPEPEPAQADEDAEMKKMIVQMLLSSLLGGLFGGK